MIRETVKQFPILIFGLFVVLCVSFDAYKALLLLTCMASICWLAYAHLYSHFSIRTFLKPKKSKSV